MSTASIQTTTLTTLASKINEAHTAAITSARTAIEQARQAGVLLLEAKTRCPHGEWQEWLKENIEFAGRTARKYMQVAKDWNSISSKWPTTAVLGIDEALELVSKHRPPDPRRQRLTKLLRSQTTNEIAPAKRPGPIDGSGEDNDDADIDLDHRTDGESVDPTGSDDGHVDVEYEPPPRKPRYTTSERFCSALNDICCRLSGIRAQFGSLDAMFKSKLWNGERTDYAIKMVDALYFELGKLRKEMKDHEAKETMNGSTK